MQPKIVELFVAEALRAYLVEADGTGLLAAGGLADNAVSKAIDAIRERFHEPWTVPSLAMHVGLSWTALATRFRVLVGDSPMHYLTRVRINHAASLKATTRFSQAQIAHRTGYANTAALAKPFRRERGATLGSHRAAARAVPPIGLAAIAVV